MNRKVFLTLAACIMSCGGLAGERTEVKELKVLMIGNSFSICVGSEMPKVAKSMGLKLDLASLYIGGCSLERHWANWVAGFHGASMGYDPIDGKLLITLRRF